MQSQSLKKIFAIAVVIALIVIGFVIYFGKDEAPLPVEEKIEKPFTAKNVIGKSVNGLDIENYSFGNGEKHITFVGGIHGGYEWNTVLLAYKLIDYLKANPETVPKNITIDVIPAMNPDGVYTATGKEGRFALTDISDSETILANGRFNGNKVDLNRNFDCKWQPESVWRSKKVSSGTEEFSEPESKAFLKYTEENNPVAVVFWHSQSNAVYTSQCEDGILAETNKIINAYSKASDYPVAKSFDAYAITGAVDDWLAKIGIPAFSVELKTHETIEWEENILGVKAMLEYFGKED